jgi:hypothetical protein
VKDEKEIIFLFFDRSPYRFPGLRGSDPDHR